MNVRRGDVILARFPHASGGRGKKRPVIVVQGDGYNQRLRHAVVAQVTTNLAERHDPACLFIDAASPPGKVAGLNRDCLVSCYMLSLMSEDRLQNVVGRLSPQLLTDLDECLKAALSIA
jgi:mRNA interferase MazF